MADQKRWFKVWTSLLVDMDFMSAEMVGHWLRLGCRIALVGDGGTVKFEFGLRHVAKFLNLLDNSEEHVREVLKTLPGITFQEGFEEGKNRDGELTVTMTNWHYYQVDRTGAERMKTLRSKRRGEERRGDKRRGEKNKEPQAAFRDGANPEQDVRKWPDPELLFKKYNAETPEELSAVEKLTPARIAKAKAYLKIFPDEDFWTAVFKEISNSLFLRGIKKNGNGNGHESFRADMDWLLSKGKDGSENAVKVYEGKYRNG